MPGCGKGIHDVQVAIARVTSSSNAGGTATTPLTTLAVTMVGSPSVGGEEWRRRGRYRERNGVRADAFRDLHHRFADSARRIERPSALMDRRCGAFRGDA